MKKLLLPWLLSWALLFSGLAHADLMLTGVGSPGIQTPFQIFGSNLKGQWAGDNPLNTISGGTTFTKWADESGNSGPDLNANNGVAVHASGINGHTTGLLDSSLITFFQSTASLALSQPITFAVIFKPTAVAVTGNDRFLMFNDANSGFHLTYNDGASPTLIAAAGGSISTAALADDNVMTLIVHYEGTSSFMSLNGGAKVGVGTDIGALGLATIDLGLHPGANADFCENGDVLEYEVISGSITDAQLSKFNAYLLNRAGI